MRLISDETLGALTVWMEARGEIYEGKIAVAEVIQRRAVRKFMSDGTIVGTVLRPYQFSGWNTQDPNRLAAARLTTDNNVYQDCLKAWQEVAAGVSVVPNAVSYFNPAGVTRIPTWATPDKLICIIDHHHFYSG